MRSLLVLSLVASVGLLLTPPAQAAEVYRGTISVIDAGAGHNLALIDGGSFTIPAFSRITVQPSAAAYVCVEQLSDAGAPTCSATNGAKVAADEKFPSSCQASHSTLLADGGLGAGCIVMIQSVATAAVSAPVWTRGESGAPSEGR